MEAQTVRVRCFDCGHEWQQLDTAELATCPECGGADLVLPETDELAETGLAEPGTE